MVTFSRLNLLVILVMLGWETIVPLIVGIGDN